MQPQLEAVMELTGTAIQPKPSDVSEEARVQRLRQLAVDLTRAVDVAEEQRRLLGDLTDHANELSGGSFQILRTGPSARVDAQTLSQRHPAEACYARLMRQPPLGA
jgi:hypothetical protein